MGWSKLVAEDFTHVHAPESQQHPVLLPNTEREFIKKMINDELQELSESESVLDQQDAFVDMIYYLLDTGAKNGWNLDPLFYMVHEANIRKIEQGVVKKDGKVQKPEGWEGPDKQHEEILKRHEIYGSWA